MSWRPLDVATRPVIDDPGSSWADCGAQALTAPGVGVPGRLVRTVAGLCGRLDAQGAALSPSFGPGGLRVLTERAAILGLAPASTVSCGGASRMVRCLDGWVAVALARPDDIEAIPAWLGIEVAGDEDPWPVVERRARRLAAAEVTERAVLLGVPCATVGEQHAREPVLACRLGAAAPRPLAGRRVANLAGLWAGPLAGDILARMGADVIVVESLERPDGARATPGFHAAMHGRTRSVALPFGTDSGRRALADLLSSVDVVIEGSRPRALEQLGIDARATVGNGPHVWLSITAHGRGNGAGHRVGFGDDAAAAGGLCGWLGDTPVFLADAVADPLTGLTAAAAIVELLRRGGRWLADVALSRVAAAAAGEWSAPTAVAAMPAVCRPVRRARRPLGADTDAVLAELGIPRP